MAFSKELCTHFSFRSRHECTTCRRKDDRGRVCKKHTPLGKEATLEANLWQIDIGDSVEGINSAVSNQPMQFICKFWCSLLPRRPNTSINFSLVDVSKMKLCLSPYLFITKAWSSWLQHYPDVLRLNIVIFLRQSASLRYKEVEAFIFSPYLSSAFLDPRKIDDKLSDSLVAGHVSQILSSPPFVCSLLGLVPKGDGEFWEIHHFFFPLSSYTNDYISKKAVHLHYTTRDNLPQKVVAARRYCVIIKRKIKNAFRNILMTSHV